MMWLNALNEGKAARTPCIISSPRLERMPVGVPAAWRRSRPVEHRLVDLSPERGVGGDELVDLVRGRG